MFNRTGNITVLSLSRRRNAIIENLHTYKNKSNTWHFRLKRKFPEEDFSDFASIRIYWKYPREETAKSTNPEEADKAVQSEGQSTGPPE